MGLSRQELLEWVAMPFSRGSSRPRDWTWVSCIAGGFLTVSATSCAQWMDEWQTWLLHHVEKVGWATPYALYKILIYLLILAALGLSPVACELLRCGGHVGSCSPARVWTSAPPALGAWSPTHWTTREVPIGPFYSHFFVMSKRQPFILIQEKQYMLVKELLASMPPFHLECASLGLYWEARDWVPFFEPVGLCLWPVRLLAIQ